MGRKAVNGAEERHDDGPPRPRREGVHGRAKEDRRAVGCCPRTEYAWLHAWLHALLHALLHVQA